MIFFKINNEDKNYIYQQIYQEIKKAILEKKIPTKEKLPSKRKLAEKLGVSINSVSNAYEQLLAEGYIYTIQRKGYFVEEITRFADVPNQNQTFPADLKESQREDKGWLSLSHMTADISKFPFKEWMKCERMAIHHHQKELAEISNPQGPYLIRQTISRMIAVSRGVVCEPEQIIIGPGTNDLVRQLMLLQQKNTKVAIENPGYSRLFKLFQNMNFHIHPIPLDKKGVNLNKVKSINPDFLFITPSHQFPTGTIMPISRRIELLNWAARSGSYIVEDDYDSEFKYGTDNIPSLQSLDRNERVIYTGTFSKTMLPSFRISYMVLPAVLLRKYRAFFSDWWIQGSNTLHLFTLHYFIETGEYQRHLKRMNHFYEKKREFLMRELKSTFKQQIKIHDIPAGLHFLAEFETGKTYEEIEAQAKKEKLEIYFLTRFLLDEKTKKERNNIALVLGFANIQLEDIPEAVERLYRVLN